MHIRIEKKLAESMKLAFGQCINLNNMPIVRMDRDMPKITSNILAYAGLFVSSSSSSLIRLCVCFCRRTFRNMNAAEIVMSVVNMPLPGISVIFSNDTRKTIIIAPIISFFLFMTIFFLLFNVLVKLCYIVICRQIYNFFVTEVIQKKSNKRLNKRKKVFIFATAKKDGRVAQLDRATAF